jgi:hypothetical protein
MRAYLNEIYVLTLVSATKFAEAVALKILKIDPPAPFARSVGREVVLSGRVTFADCCNVLPHVSGQIVDMMGVVQGLVRDGAAFGDGRKLTEEQNGGG